MDVAWFPVRKLMRNLETMERRVREAADSDDAYPTRFAYLLPRGPAQPRALCDVLACFSEVRGARVCCDDGRVSGVVGLAMAATPFPLLSSSLHAQKLMAARGNAS